MLLRVPGWRRVEVSLNVEKLCLADRNAVTKALEPDAHEIDFLCLLGTGSVSFLSVGIGSSSNSFSGHRSALGCTTFRPLVFLLRVLNQRRKGRIDFDSESCRFWLNSEDDLACLKELSTAWLMIGSLEGGSGNRLATSDESLTKLDMLLKEN